MERTPVRSTDISIIGYDEASAQLEVAFRSGSVYRYLNVPKSTHRDFLLAESHGIFFRDRIRNNFITSKVIPAYVSR